MLLVLASRALLAPEIALLGLLEFAYLFAVYRRAPALALARSRLADPAGDRSLTGLLGGLRTLVVEEPQWRPLDPDGRSFVDLDDPADLEAWDPGSR